MAKRPGMAVRFLPAGLILATLAADVGGFHAAGYFLLVAAVPAAAVAALTQLGDLLEAAEPGLGRVQTLLAAVLLLTVLLATAVRGHSAAESAVPPFSTSLLATAVALLVLQASVAALAALAPAQPRSEA